MFVNYFNDDGRSSPLNLAVARLVLGGWLIWKTAMYDWYQFLDAPVHLTPVFTWAIPPVAPAFLLTIEKWLLIALLTGFILGYRIRLTAGMSALIVAHLGTVRMTQITSGESEALFIGVYALIMFALFAEADRLSIDEWRRMRSASTDTLRSRLTDPPTRFAHPALKWSLLIVALIYFGSAFDKIFHRGVTEPTLAFASSDNMARIATTYRSSSPLQFLVDYPLLMRLGGLATLGLEFGLLIAVLVGITVTPFLLGLIVFTLSNALLLGIHFVDVYFLVLLFLAWDRVLPVGAQTTDLQVVFDPVDRTVMQALIPVAYLAAPRGTTFTPVTASDRVTMKGAGIVVSDGHGLYVGYQGVQRLCRQLVLGRPLAWVMNRPVIARTSTVAYRAIVSR